MGIHGCGEVRCREPIILRFLPINDPVFHVSPVELRIISVCTTAFNRRTQQLRERNEYHGGNDSLDDPRKVLLSSRVWGTRGETPGVGSPRKHDTTIRRYAG